MSSSDGIPVDVMVVDGEEGEIRQPGGRLDCFVAAFLLNEDIVELEVPWESVPGQLCDVMRLPRSAVVFLRFLWQPETLLQRYARQHHPLLRGGDWIKFWQICDHGTQRWMSAESGEHRLLPDAHQLRR